MGYEKWEIAQLQSRVRYWNELIMKLIDGLIKNNNNNRVWRA